MTTTLVNHAQDREMFTDRATGRGTSETQGTLVLEPNFPTTASSLGAETASDPWEEDLTSGSLIVAGGSIESCNRVCVLRDGGLVSYKSSSGAKLIFT